MYFFIYKIKTKAKNKNNKINIKIIDIKMLYEYSCLDKILDLQNAKLINCVRKTKTIRTKQIEPSFINKMNKIMQTTRKRELCKLCNESFVWPVN